VPEPLSEEPHVPFTQLLLWHWALRLHVAPAVLSGLHSPVVSWQNWLLAHWLSDEHADEEPPEPPEPPELLHAVAPHMQTLVVL
jgi:hypothetical protein